MKLKYKCKLSVESLRAVARDIVYQAKSEFKDAEWIECPELSVVFPSLDLVHYFLVTYVYPNPDAITDIKIRLRNDIEQVLEGKRGHCGITLEGIRLSWKYVK